MSSRCCRGVWKCVNQPGCVTLCTAHNVHTPRSHSPLILTGLLKCLIIRARPLQNNWEDGWGCESSAGEVWLWEGGREIGVAVMWHIPTFLCQHKKKEAKKGRKGSNGGLSACRVVFLCFWGIHKKKEHLCSIFPFSYCRMSLQILEVFY